MWDYSSSRTFSEFPNIQRWGCAMGVRDPEVRKKVFGPRWQHEIENQGWPLWKRLIHRLQRCPICRPQVKNQDRKTQCIMRERPVFGMHGWEEVLGKSAKE